MSTAVVVGAARHTSSESEPHPLRALDALPAHDYAALRRRVLLEGYEWDPQIADIEGLARFPLVLKSRVWKSLAAHAEALCSEAAQAELEVLSRPQLLSLLGLPRALRRVLAGIEPMTPAVGRVMRFDFHWTRGGWRISEANSDVPGGFSEGSFFTARMAEHFPGLRPAGDPGTCWSHALARATGPNAAIALLSAPGFMEDHQVIAYLAALLRERGLRAYLAKPEQLRWRDGAAHLESVQRGPLDAIVRFYQAEWLAHLPEGCGWRHLLRGGRTPVANPGASIISESKRFPLVWDRLSTALPNWRALLPETRDPRQVSWSGESDWLLKAALCNNGDAVIGREQPLAWKKARFRARLAPGTWLAQRRFESVPLATPLGPRHACIGIYTVNGIAAGAYARLSTPAIVDFAAVDVALLLEDR